MTKLLMACLMTGVLAAACGTEKQEPAPAKDEPKAAPAKPEPAPEPAPAPAKPEPVAEAPTAAAPAAAEPPEVIALKAEGGTKDAVPFPHKKHAGLDAAINAKGCETCHHAPQGDDKNPGCKTEGCHDGKTAGVPRSKDAHHKLCKDGCHKVQLTAEPGSEALKKVKGCAGCHAGA
jgi:hypothetical protein